MADIPYAFLKRFRVQNIIAREFFAEFLGTFVLILIGDAAFAQAVLGGKGIQDVFAVVWAWGVAVMLAVATCGGISGGHVNPAVTVAFATLGKFPWKKVGHYLLAQHLGGFIASAVLYATYYDALDNLDPNRTVSGKTATAYIWATYPRENITLANCFLDQVVGTGLLMFTAMAIVDQKNTDIPKYLHGLLIGFMISALAMCFGFNCMAPLNPARDFPTRAFTAMVGYGGETFWAGNYYWWIGVVPTHVGAILGGWLYYLGIELHWPDQTPHLHKEQYELTTPLNSHNDRKGGV